MHHEIASMFLDVELLEQEPEVADLELANLVASPVFMKTKVDVKAFRQFEVLGGNEGLQIHDFSL
jgi:hypothetical protein